MGAKRRESVGWRVLLCCGFFVLASVACVGCAVVVCVCRFPGLSLGRQLQREAPRFVFAMLS
jgi:hypothetical protein